jgi:Na+/H+ antiporter NhaC
MPVIVTIIDALITRRVVEALCAGIIVASLIATNGDPVQSVVSIAGRFIDEGFSADHLCTILFLIILGGLIELLTHSGGLRAYTNAMSRSITTRRQAESASLFLSALLFIDDYLNSLMVGAIMRPLTDRFHIPRVKLAYLINALSASLCVLIPASSWVAMSIAQFQNGGVSLVRGANTLILDDPYGLYCMTICAMFYPIFSVISASFFAATGFSYGPMASAERHAVNAASTREEQEDPIAHDGELWDLAFPLGIFVTTLCIVMLTTGEFVLFGGEQSFFSALERGNPFLGLFLASVTSVTAAAGHLLSTGKQNLKAILHHLKVGAIMMQNSCSILILAWTFGSYLRDDLKTGEVLAHLVISGAGASVVPVLIFGAAIIMTATTGSAWGTIAILVPLVIPLVVGMVPLTPPLYVEQVPLLIYALASIFSGAVAGGHISPLTDASVMAATSARAPHIDHIRTQIPYVLPALCGALVAYTGAGFLLAYGIKSVALVSLLSGLITLGAVATLLHRMLHLDRP